MTKMTQEEIDEAQRLYVQAEVAVRRLAEYMDQFGKKRIANTLTGVSQLVTAKARSDDGYSGVWVVRAVIPTTTGECNKAWPHASKVRLEKLPNE